MGEATLYPLILDPYPHKPIWGGHRLAREFHKGDVRDSRIGESWEIFQGNRVANGPLKGWLLADLIRDFAEQLIGCDGMHAAGGCFPLLIKLVDTEESLSIQVHPNDEQAARLEGKSFGKTEAWYILSASPEARLVYGLSREVSRRELRERAASGTIEQVLHYVNVQPGDTFLVEANTIHAIGAGILLYEIQQPSDITYRLYDWNRKTPEGQTRDLHLDKATEVASLTAAMEGQHRPVRIVAEDSVTHDELMRCPHFVLERVTLSKPWTRVVSGRSFEALTVIEGAVQIFPVGERPQAERLGACHSILIPAAVPSYTLLPESRECQVLLARLPEG